EPEILQLGSRTVVELPRERCDGTWAEPRSSAVRRPLRERDGDRTHRRRRGRAARNRRRRRGGTDLYVALRGVRLEAGHGERVGAIHLELADAVDAGDEVLETVDGAAAARATRDGHRGAGRDEADLRRRDVTGSVAGEIGAPTAPADAAHLLRLRPLDAPRGDAVARRRARVRMEPLQARVPALLESFRLGF